jgi:outer membrane protein assembly factor BamB
VVIVGLMWAALIVPVLLDMDPMQQFPIKFFATMGTAGALALWWLAVSRVRWYDRLLVLAVFAAGAGGAYALAHPNLPPGQMRIFALLLFALPVAASAWVGWLLVTPFLAWPARRAGLLVALLLGWGYFTLQRIDGFDGSFHVETSWRWAPTAEDKLLADLASRKAGPADAAATQTLTLAPGDWPGFRGAARDGRLVGVRISTDWAANPPREVWRQRVGPGWGAFTVVGDRIFTQEQRGENEVVVSYQAGSGKEIWAYNAKARFSEAIAGPGPRATPTFHEGKLYTLGAAGHLACLDAASGKEVWSRDVAADSGAKVPMWGFSSSPLVQGDVVSVFAGGPDGKAVLGYRAASGELAWAAGEGQFSYCSPHPSRLGGVEQQLICTEKGLTAFAPATGKVLWKHEWELPGGMARVTQPAAVDGADFLIGTYFGHGTRRVHVEHKGDAWADTEVWTTKAIKPYYNDLVVHKDDLYGFDGALFVCVGLADGKERWKARGYGNGQVLLLADQGLLLVLSEKGEVVLLEATPEKHKVLGRFQAIQGKTWNHPVIAHGRLFVRNGEEAACFQLGENVAKGDAGK